MLITWSQRDKHRVFYTEHTNTCSLDLQYLTLKNLKHSHCPLVTESILDTCQLKCVSGHRLKMRTTYLAHVNYSHPNIS
jgi:hypothetical protein